MQIHNVTQGSDEWARLRAQHFTASEAPVVMGASPYESRADLLRKKAVGAEEELSAYRQRIMNRGHEYEAAARPIAEEIIGEELYPATVTADAKGLPLLASVDGMDMAGDIVWEHKTYRDDLAEQVAAGQVPEEHAWQLDQQMLVTGATWALYMVSDGTRERCEWCWRRHDPTAIPKLIRAWEQFRADLAEYEPPQDDGPAPAGSAPEQLPALRVEVRGEVTASNIEQFREHALAVFQGINTRPATDEEFADAEKAIKWCKEVETRLEAAKEHALSQTEDLDRLFKTIDELKEEARSRRLEADKAVKARKQAVREEIIGERQRALADMVAAYERELGVRIDTGADFGSAIKGKKTVKSVRDAADQELADAKVELQEEADRIRANLERYRELVGDRHNLFPDWAALIRKSREDMEAQIQTRLAEEEKRLEAERERTREEEARKAEQQEAAQAADEQPADTRPAVDAEAAVEQAAAATHGDDEPADDGARMTLGELNEAIAPLSISAAGLSELGIEPVGRRKAAKLYRSADLPQICEVLRQHLLRAATEQSKEAA